MENLKPANDSITVMNFPARRSGLTKRVIFGALLGLAWGAALRAWMTVLAVQIGESPSVSWRGTFAAVLLPAALMGAVLGTAVYIAETSDKRHWRWAVLSPLLLALIPVIVLDDFIPNLIATGLGGGAIVVALIGLFGGFALSGFGALWMRLLSGLLVIVPIAFLAYGGAVPTSPGLAFCALLFFLLVGLLIAGVSTPSRYWFNRHTSNCSVQRH
ncbi:MAG: hypothetical protein M3384_17290 [Acidobacteriota bacterium]|nr:hypothetical protein [Acidobacteriota bacterium]